MSFDTSNINSLDFEGIPLEYFRRRLFRIQSSWYDSTAESSKFYATTGIAVASNTIVTSSVPNAITALARYCRPRYHAVDANHKKTSAIVSSPTGHHLTLVHLVGNFPIVNLAPSSKHIQSGAKVWVVGYKKIGIIAGILRQITNEPLLLVCLEVQVFKRTEDYSGVNRPGMLFLDGQVFYDLLGAAVFDERGMLVGCCVNIQDSMQPTFVVYPVESIRELLASSKLSAV